MNSAAAVFPSRGSEKNLADEMRLGLQRFRTKSSGHGIFLFFLDASAYAALFLVLATFRLPLVLELPLSLFLGFIITRLFIVGHDAAHGSLTGHPLLNEIVARLAFLPALHPRSLWQLGHNRVHHSFTNLKGVDFIWMPYSPGEYNNLPRWRQIAERCYRSFFGMGAYYMIEIWWNYLSFKGVNVLGKGRKTYMLDVGLSVGFLCLQVAVVLALPARAILWAVIIPFLAWNWLMGFIIYNHHTNPSVRFYNNRKQWRFYEGQVKGTVHLVFPQPFGWFLNQIMEHTAHHIDVNIPFYRLRAAQHFLEARMKEDLIVQRWSLRGFLSTLRCCQLYDYDQHRWVTLDEAKGCK